MNETGEIVHVDPVSQLTGRWRLVYEVAMGAMALTVVALLPVDDVGWLRIVNTVVWAAFVVDYLVRLGLSENRTRFVRTQWLDFVAILPADIFRAARGLRLLRLLRAGRMFWRSSSTVRGILNTNGLSTVLAVSAGVIVCGGLAIWVVEPDMGTLGDGMWWSMVTATTVGYGDLSPVTAMGRAVAVILMVVGIGTIGMITGSVATYFVEDRRPDLPPHVAFARDELNRWHELTDDERHRVADILRSVVGETPR